LRTTKNLEGVDLVGKSGVWVVEGGQNGGSRATSDLPSLESISGDGGSSGDGSDDRGEGVDSENNGDEGFGKTHLLRVNGRWRKGEQHRRWREMTAPCYLNLRILLRPTITVSRAQAFYTSLFPSRLQLAATQQRKSSVGS
jgi:hypothetical protein